MTLTTRQKKRVPADAIAPEVTTVTETAPVIMSFKGFDQTFSCRGYKFEIGGTYSQAGKIEACGNGFHACESPFDVWSYYPPNGANRFAMVAQTGAIARHHEDTKIASATVTVHAEIKLPEYIKAAVNWLVKITKEAATAGDYAHAATTGSYAHAATTGDNAHAATAGDYAHAATAGVYADAATAGDYAHAATTGSYAHAATAGVYADAATTGNGANAATAGSYAHAATAGVYADAATTGNGANAATTGNGANAATAGDYAHAATTGSYANAATTGNGANAATAGDGSIAAALGSGSKAKAGAGGAIALCHRDTGGTLICVRAAMVGLHGIEPGVWYRLTASCEFEECEE